MSKGFTLIELLIVLAITVILAVGGFLGLSGFKRQQSLQLSVDSMVTFLRNAQSKAIGQEDGYQWGVRFDNSASGRDAYSLFQGAVFTSAVTVVALPASVEFEDPASGFKDVVFAKATGLPNSETTVKIRLIGDSTSAKTITINVQTGTIQGE